MSNLTSIRLSCHPFTPTNFVENVKEIKIDNIEEGGQTFTFGADGTVTETKGTGEASDEEEEEEIDESKIGLKTVATVLVVFLG